MEQLGANLSGKNSAGETNVAGVYTGKPHDLATSYYRAYLGRLNESKWAGFKPADVAAWKAPKATVPATAAPTTATGGGGGIGDTILGLGSSALGMAGDAMSAASDMIFGAPPAATRTAPTTAPATATPAAAQPFEARGVKGCDYRVQSNGTIEFVKGGKVARTFPKTDALYAKLRAEILEVYPALGQTSLR